MHVFSTENHKRNKVFQNHMQKRAWHIERAIIKVRVLVDAGSDEKQGIYYAWHKFCHVHSIN